MSTLHYKNIHPLVPETIEAFNYINDVLLFHKELEDGDTFITFLINAKVKKQSPLDALRQVLDCVVEQRIRVMSIVEARGSLEWKKRIQQFYLAMHLGATASSSLVSKRILTVIPNFSTKVISTKPILLGAAIFIILCLENQDW